MIRSCTFAIWLSGSISVSFCVRRRLTSVPSADKDSSESGRKIRTVPQARQNSAAAQPVTQELEPDEPPAQNPEPEEEPEPEQDWDEEARYMAQACFGEGWICQSKTEWAAIYWNILNRVDSDDPYYPDNIISVVTQSAQYHGYDPTNPVLPVLKELALDVIDRWQREKQGETDVGRVLPPEYLFFGGDGKHNTFRTEWDGGEYWDWSWPSPYES